MRGLQESSSNCHLCRLLLQSANAKSSMESTESQEGLERHENEPKPNPTVLQEEKTTIRVWRERARWEKGSVGDSGLKIQLHGGDVKYARPLEILEVNGGKPFTSIVDPSWPKVLGITD